MKLAVIQNQDILGIEESIENKGRFTTVTVLSKEATSYKLAIEVDLNSNRISS